MSSEGSREIDAARKRLAAAKTQAASASTNMESAKAMMAAAEIMMTNAQSQIQSSSKELDDATIFLVEAEKRWEVIDIDEVPDSPEEKRKNKRRKVPSLPIVDVTTSQAPAAAIDARASTNAVAVGTATSSNVDKVIVEGCGLSEVNGTYDKKGLHNGSPRYIRRGQWEGRTVQFVIRCTASGKRWRLLVFDTDGNYIELLYKSHGNPTNPPKSGWKVKDKGVEPAPIMTILPQGE